MSPKKELKIKKIVRILLQIAAFLLIPGMFASGLAAITELVRLLFSGAAAPRDWAEPLIVLAATVPSTVLFGRYFCGYFCSFGAMQDLAGFLGRKLLKGSPVLPKKAVALLGPVKYVILAACLIFAAAGISVRADLSPWTVFGMVTGRGP